MTAEQGGRGIGWPRAIATGVVILIVALIATVLVPHEILTKVTSFDRAGRERLAAAVFVVALGALAWGLRRLQARGII